jgi:hypothetical protein
MELQKGCLGEARDQRHALPMFLPSSFMLELVIIALQMSISISVLVTGTFCEAKANFLGEEQRDLLEIRLADNLPVLLEWQCESSRLEVQPLMLSKPQSKYSKIKRLQTQDTVATWQSTEWSSATPPL